MNSPNDCQWHHPNRPHNVMPDSQKRATAPQRGADGATRLRKMVTDRWGLDPSLAAVMAARRVCARLVVGDERFFPFRSDLLNEVFW